MFTGIIEAMAEVSEIRHEGSNITFVMKSHMATDLKIDQSLSHNGVCLTVTQVWDEHYTVTAIQETLQKTNLGHWKVGTKVNLERCMPINGRFDGHIVQGHVDQTAVCTQVQSMDGSWIFDFQYDASQGNITVEKGSICVNGVSLTVVNSQDNSFQVAIIPYTYEHTNFQELRKADRVNLEFDVIGKYLMKIIQKNYPQNS